MARPFSDARRRPEIGRALRWAAVEASVQIFFLSVFGASEDEQRTRKSLSATLPASLPGDRVILSLGLHAASLGVFYVPIFFCFRAPSSVAGRPA